MKITWYKIENKKFNTVDNRSGIYLISTLQKCDNKYAVKYVGQSENLHDRIIEHFGKNESNEELLKHLSNNYLTKVNYAYVNKEYLDGIEKFLYDYFNPKYNNISPPGNSIIKCNLPDVRNDD